MRRRVLRPGELALWEKVTRTVAPLREAPPEPLPPPVAGRTEPAARKEPEPRPAADGAPKVRRSAPPPGDIDRKTRRKLNRGTMEIEARLDLHGMTLDEAEGRLRRFVEEASGRGVRAALVITGKGRAGEGILRRAVPQWLARAELRRHVVSFGPAGPGHGGEGALYVRLRSAKGPPKGRRR